MVQVHSPESQSECLRRESSMPFRSIVDRSESRNLALPRNLQMCAQMSSHQPGSAEHVVVKKNDQRAARCAPTHVTHCRQTPVCLQLYDPKPMTDVEISQSQSGPFIGSVDDHNNFEIRCREVLLQRCFDRPHHALAAIRGRNDD